MARIQVFDVNETLLDVGALAPHFTRAFGDDAAVREWFSTLLLYSEVATLAGPYADFAAIGGAMRALPPHLEVAVARQRLRIFSVDAVRRFPWPPYQTSSVPT